MLPVVFPDFTSEPAEGLPAGEDCAVTTCTEGA